MPITLQRLAATLPDLIGEDIRIERTSLYADDQLYPGAIRYEATVQANGIATFDLPVPDDPTQAAAYVVTLPPGSRGTDYPFTLAQGSPATLEAILKAELSMPQWSAVQQLFSDFSARLAPVEAAPVVTTAATGGFTGEQVLGTAVIMRGTLAARPVAGVAGRLYYVTDGARLYRDSGTAWEDYGEAAGATHDPVTVTDSTSIDLTLTGQALTAAAIFGTTAGTVAQGNDARLSDARTPTAHAASHATGGTDVVTPAAIGAAAATHAHAAGDVTSGTLATARLGSGTADATTFLRGDQTWAVPAGGTATKACGVTLTADYAVANLTEVIVNWQSELYDTANMFALDTNPSRITIPEAGRYMIYGNLTWAPNTSGWRQVGLNLNGTKIRVPSLLPTHGATATPLILPFITELTFAQGDFIELFARQNTGSTINLSEFSGRSTLYVRKVS